MPFGRCQGAGAGGRGIISNRQYIAQTRVSMDKLRVYLQYPDRTVAGSSLLFAPAREMWCADSGNLLMVLYNFFTFNKEYIIVRQ